MKRYLYIILLLLCLLVPYTTYAIQETTTSYVIDDVNLLNQKTKDFYTKHSDFLYKNVGISYYVVTTPSFNNMKAEKYTESVYDELSMGTKGLLILYSKKERTVRVLAGNEISNLINDKVIKNYLDNYFVPKLKAGEIDEGIKNGYSAFYKLICNYYNIDSSDIEIEPGPDILTTMKTPILFAIMWISTTLCYVFCHFFKRLFNNKKNSIIDYMIFIICFIIHIILLSFAYSIDPKSLIGILGLEGLMIYSLFFISSPPKSSKSKKKSRKKRKKR